MSKEKQIIEEMARDICENYNDDGTCYCDGKPCDLKCECFTDAQYLYKKDYRKQSEGPWISVDERLPEARETILCFDGGWVDACFFDGDDFMTLDTYESDKIDGVTHWMPLPEAPKMKGENNG